MFRNWLLGLLIAAALSVCLSSGAFGQVPNPTHVFYVNPAAGNAWPDGEGDSWDDAFLDLVVAIAEAPDIAGPNAVIRLNVAGGTYFGQSFVIHDHDPIKIEHVGAFAIPDGMLIYGGYAGSGPNPDARDPAEWTTTLTGLIELDVPAPAVCGLPTSGDCFTFVEHPELGCDDVDCCAVVCQLLRSCCEVGWDELCADRAKRLCIDAPFEARVDSVVATVGSGSTRRLDGLTIAGGGVRPNLHTGAGAAAGGGIYMTSQDTSADVGLDIVRCVIIDNWGATGGGIALVGDPTVADCTGTGRAVRARIWNCEIVENVAGTWGGGVYARYHAQYEIVNSVIAQNSYMPPPSGQVITLKIGVALAEFVSPIENVERRVVNCTITGNFGGAPVVAQGAGSAPGCAGEDQTGVTLADLVIANSVIRGNFRVPIYEGDIETGLELVGWDECAETPPCDPDAPPPATLIFCNTRLPQEIPDTWHDCIDVDPGFVQIEHDPATSLFADYRLLPDSLMIDAGTPPNDDPDLILADWLDVNDDGSAVDPNRDLALELRILPGSWTTAPRVDIGAFEALPTNNCLTGDFNGDGAVDGADLGILLENWGACSSPCPWDLNGDGVVDGADPRLQLAAAARGLGQRSAVVPA